MADETTGVNTVPAAVEQSGVIVPAAEGSDLSQASATAVPEGQQSSETSPQQIPKERLDVEIGKKKEAQAEALELKQRLAVAQAMQQVQQQPQSTGSADPLARIVEGISEFPSGEEVKTALGEVGKLIGNLSTKLTLVTDCPDYNSVVGERDAVTGKYQPAFQKALEANPSIMQLIYSVPIQAQKQLAYSFALPHKDSAAPKKEPVPGIHPNAQRALTDAAIPLSPAAIGAAGGAIGKANRINDMSDKDFAAEVDKHTQEG